jgi:hypothetical protein
MNRRVRAVRATLSRRRKHFDTLRPEDQRSRKRPGSQNPNKTSPAGTGKARRS